MAVGAVGDQERIYAPSLPHIYTARFVWENRNAKLQRALRAD